MHCVDVIRELSVPTGEPDPAALAEHLAGCPRCASWGEQSARLDRLWEATRPPEPSTAAWDRVWANIAAALDRPSALVASPSPSRPDPPSVPPWRRSVLAVFTIAQAAAILAAFSVAWEVSGPSPAVAAVATVEIEPGQNARISGDRRGAVHVHFVAQVDASNAVDDNYLMFNEIESLAALQ